MNNNLYDLIISDIMMLEIDGFEFAETVRGINKTIPILFITARDNFSSKQKGFHAGIDDYMVKPINMDEMVLRVDALLRRANIAHDKKLVVGSLEMDADAVSTRLNDKEIPVTVREFNILNKLLSYPNYTFSRAQLMNEFWGTRIKSQYFSWKEFMWTYLVLITLTAGQSMIYNEYVPIKDIPSQFIFGMAGYWIIDTLIFCLVTARRSTRPLISQLKKLSKAAK